MKSISKNKHLWPAFIRAIEQYHLIDDGDKIAVCVSGGKDSMLLAKCFQMLERFTEVPFTVKFLVMDPGYRKENLEQIKKNAEHMFQRV